MTNGPVETFQIERIDISIRDAERDRRRNAGCFEITADGLALLDVEGADWCFSSQELHELAELAEYLEASVRYWKAKSRRAQARRRP